MASVHSDEVVDTTSAESDDLNPVVNVMQKSWQHLLTQSVPALGHRYLNQWGWERTQAPRHLASFSRRTHRLSN